jgi:hypothetical protein
MKCHYLVSEKDLINGGLPVNDSPISLRFIWYSVLDVVEISYIETLEGFSLRG